MLDPGKGDGNTFDWQMLSVMKRPYFLAGGLSPENVGEAIRLAEALCGGCKLRALRLMD
jgi:phosphoribosylanthranilate isomerase (EC 5.3.1.24)